MITKDTNILEAAQKYPEITQVFRNHGLGCLGCMMAAGETLGEGLAAHGLDVDAIINEINLIIDKK
ncbi:DUF1858 domain-containing protein [Fusobacterium sp. PH5-44]|uniref:DUF1858 domain-containing protein n=1 Tax=unclassified Fusobacterium TaxID=2648384 RepID=UPI003D1A6CD6